MDVLGTDGSSVIVKLAYGEWLALGGKSIRDRNGYYTCDCDTKDVPNIVKLVESLKAIKAASPDLERIRATFQTFLLLTDPAAVGDVLKSCGVAEPVVDAICDTADDEA